jgi:nicotinate-nucleotide adenylyltransferase
MQKKICLGGSFNPIHHAHLICARAAAEAVGADTVVLFPAGIPPHKPGETDLAAPDDRLEMCRRAIQDVPAFAIDDRELRRSGPSFTIDTVAELRRAGWDEVNWLVGADMLNILPTWHEAAALVAQARILIMARPGWNFAWESLPTEFQFLRQHVVKAPQIDISATDIRRRVGLGLRIDYLTPPAVARYIHERRLYRKP